MQASPEGMNCSSFVWDVENPNYPLQAIEPPSALCCLEVRFLLVETCLFEPECQRYEKLIERDQHTRQTYNDKNTERYKDRHAHSYKGVDGGQGVRCTSEIHRYIDTKMRRDRERLLERAYMYENRETRREKGREGGIQPNAYSDAT